MGVCQGNCKIRKRTAYISSGGRKVPDFCSCPPSGRTAGAAGSLCGTSWVRRNSPGLRPVHCLTDGRNAPHSGNRRIRLRIQPFFPYIKADPWPAGSGHGYSRPCRKVQRHFCRWSADSLRKDGVAVPSGRRSRKAVDCCRRICAEKAAPESVNGAAAAEIFFRLPHAAQKTEETGADR